ncbi:hypothetical protein Lesp02_83290 [Lentzea sp. NBRC 105346]|uniref:type I polyketide synthase n=1 Tax=Lentzea sp. NBRC 105346 TaxID=3032205 RepID=UPI0024A0FDD9|nr:type I polyketide synthase [Lentzea sp. NBRC 105346]GLZ36142.1 hypothetical protein Lesp02_83290 [Lentzea sp. NBRC 105346]
MSVPVAVVGVSALLPGSSDVDGFWRSVLRGEDQITEVPPSHWLISDYYDADPKAPDKTYGKRGAFLSPVDFDPLAFGIPPNQMEATDTTQLLSLVVADQVLRDATGGSLSSLDRDRVSVILGTAPLELLATMASRLQRPVWLKALREHGVANAEAVCDSIASHYVPWQEASFPGLLSNVVAGRIANKFDLHGTNCTTDAACASSLAALQAGMNELMLGTADMVITGGVDTLNDITMYMCFSKTPALSPSGDCKPFSSEADGTILGEGLVMFALKRLADAERDGDHVYAVLKGLGTASDGRSTAIYAPLPEGQARALRRAYSAAGYGPDSVELVEAHGTGTTAGDLAEFTALRTVFSESGRVDSQWCALGSVKSQIGHTKAAAGAAGMLKAVLSLHHKVLPPTIKVSEPSPKLDLASSPMYLNTSARPWIRSSDHPRRASVSSFGFGGSNFHLTLEEYVPGNGGRTPWRVHSSPAELVLLSAASPEELARKASQVDTSAALADIARSSQSSFVPTDSARLAVVASSSAELATRLSLAVSGTQAPGVMFASGDPDPGLVGFVFSGQGSQYVGMGADLAMEFPAARAVWDSVADILPVHTRVFPVPVFSDAERASQQEALTATEWAQPALAAASLAQLALLDSLKVSPDAVAGHSFGELVALHTAGAFSADSLVRLARCRGEAMRDASVSGVMLAVSAPFSAVSAVVSELDGVWVANHNSPTQVVVSGTAAGVSAVESHFSALGVTCRRLETATAFHSPLVASAGSSLSSFLGSIEVGSPRIPVYGNADASVYPTSSDAIRSRIASHLATPVRFVDEIEAMYAAGVRTFVEVGAGSVLTGLVGKILAGRPHVAVSLDRKGKHGVTALFEALGVLAVNGVAADFDALWAHVAPPAEVVEETRPRLVKQVSGANYGKPYPPLAPVAAPSPAVADLVLQVVAEKTGYPAEVLAPDMDLEVDLGIDSIKRVEILAVVRRSVPGLPDLEVGDLGKLRTLGEITSRLGGAVVAPVQPQAAVPAAAHAPAPAAAAAVVPAAALAPAAAVVHASAAAVMPAAALAPATAAVHAPAAVPAETSVPAATPTAAAVAAASAPALVAPAPAAALGATQLPAPSAALAPAFAVATSAPAATQPPMPAPAPASTSVAGLEKLVLDVVAEKTGYPADMLAGDMDLEADLGIDSIKRVEILSAVRRAVPGLPEVDPVELGKLRTLGEITDRLGGAVPAPDQPQAPAAASAPAPAPVSAQPATSVAGLEKLVLDVVAEKTGYPADMLASDMDLEADLGIDSIKRVEILSAVRRAVPELPEVDPVELGKLRTLGEITDRLGGVAPAPEQPQAPAVTPAPAAAPVEAPAVVPVPVSAPAATSVMGLEKLVLDVVAEKTGYPADMLAGDMDLEADLGIDSIKRVEILSAVRRAVPELPEVDPVELGKLRTLGEITDRLGGGVGAAPMQPQAPAAAQPPAAAAAPVATLPQAAAAVPAFTQPQAPAAPPATAFAPTTAQTPAPAQPPAPMADLEKLVLDVVAEKTGYPADMLASDMDLEADLGIDSIKRVEILSAVRRAVPQLPEVDPVELSKLRTLGEITASLGNTKQETKQAKPEQPDLVRRAVRMKEAAPCGLSLPGLRDGQVTVTDDGTGVARHLVARLKAKGINAHQGEVSETTERVVHLGGLKNASTIDQAIEIQKALFRDARKMADNAKLFVTVQDTGGDYGIEGTERAWVGGVAGLTRTAAREWPDATTKTIDIQRGRRTPSAVAEAIAKELLTGGSSTDIGLKANGQRSKIHAIHTKAEPHRKIQGVIVATGGARGVTAQALIELARQYAPKILLLGRTERQQDTYKAKDETELRRLIIQQTGKKPAEVNAIVADILKAREVEETIERIREAGSEVRYANVDTRDPEALKATLAEARAWGPITGIVHGAGVLADKRIAEKTDEQFAKVFDTKVKGLQALLEATKDDPLETICLFSSISAFAGNAGQCDYAMANEVLNQVAHAQKREGCTVRSIAWGPWAGGMVNPALKEHFESQGVPLIPVDEGARQFVAELTSGGDTHVVITKGEHEETQTEHGEVDLNEYSCLNDHAINGTPVVPMALALEWFAGFAPAVTDVKVLRKLGPKDKTQIKRSNGHLEITNHYQAKVTSINSPQRWDTPEGLREINPDVYNGHDLFHGPAFQVIQEIKGLSRNGGEATVTGAREAGWCGTAWNTDPAAIDGGFQLAVLWARHVLGKSALPMGVRESRTHRKGLHEGSTRVVLTARGIHQDGVECDIAFIDEHDEVIAELLGVEMVAWSS